MIRKGNNLNGMIAVVTGSAQGIGRSVALALASNGVTVYCLDILEKENLSTAISATELLGSKCYAYYCDVSNPLEVKKVFEKIISKHHTVDILINNTAVFSMFSFVNNSYEEALSDYEYNMNVNVKGTFLCSKMVAPIMAKQGKGHIINVNTNHIKRQLFSVSRNEHSYDASKYAQQSLNQSLARELYDYGVRVNAICPAATRTPMLNSYFKKEDLPLTAQSVGKATSIASLLEPNEVADAICGMLKWPFDSPVGKEYLVMYSKDCRMLADHPVEELAR